ncbi:IgA FC receptor precursor [Aquisphaera giovannonii]|uniref:IgA FC receptor n=1 Tax=Aquisphaera giovannonii TaxID=406548 RepID=A0A5B9WFM0_9BACT|nr:hypothetical protein [Aquisphaera giovannonii]QEH38690.1 IgA FC receptor precursor [Aquisphaera giovannonii]
MKRLLIVLLVIALIGWSFAAAARRRRVSESEYQYARAAEARREAASAQSDARREARRAAEEARRAMREARDEAQRALREAGREIREAFHEAREAWHQAGDENRDAWAEGADEVREAVAEAAQDARECVADIPVPIVPGTRTVEASPEPPRAPESPEAPEPPGFPGLARDHAAPQPPAAPQAPSRPRAARPQATPATRPAEPERWVVGLVSVTEERAHAEARKKLEQEVSDWLESHDIPRSWTPPARLVEGMIRESRISRIDKEYGTVYEVRIRPDFSPERMATLRQAYRDQLVRGRLVLLGSALAFVLTCLAALSGYIRADEATRGYYTNRLRMLTAVGVGAAGGAIYHWIA